MHLDHDDDDETEHWHEPVAENRAGFGKFDQPKSEYDKFMDGEGLPVFRGVGIRSVKELPLVDWKRTGGRGTFIQLHGTEGKWGCYVVEVPAGGELNVEKHVYEEVFLVVERRGSTE